jgi:hypothetical protein
MDARQKSAVAGVGPTRPAAATAEAGASDIEYTILTEASQQLRTLKTEFKIHPDLAIETLRQRRDREYRLWTLARAVDLAGSGRLRLADFQDSLIELDIRGASPGTVRRILSVGQDTFWHRYTNRHTTERWIALCGLLPVCVALGVEKLKFSPVYVPLALIQTMRRFRETIFASINGGVSG